MPSKSPARFSIAEQLQDRLVPVTESGCWLWEGAVDRSGRPVIVRGKQMRAARAMLELKLGRPIAPGMQANHHCDVPLCLNPAHLYEGTQAQNAADMARRGRGRNQFSGVVSCIHGHEFTPENTYIHPQRGTRICKRCNADRQRCDLK